MSSRHTLYIIAILSGIVSISMAIGAYILDPDIDLGIVVFFGGFSILVIIMYVLKILNKKNYPLEKVGSIPYVAYECCRYIGFIFGLGMFIYLLFAEKTPLHVKIAAIVGIPLILYYFIKHTLHLTGHFKGRK